MKSRALVLLAVSLVLGGCVERMWLPHRDQSQPPPSRPTVLAQAEPGVAQCQPINLPNWKRAIAPARWQFPYGIGSKLSAGTLLFGVVGEPWDIKTDTTAIDAVRSEAPYSIGDEPFPDAQFWKLNLATLDVERISADQWHAAGTRLSFTLGALRHPQDRRMAWTVRLRAVGTERPPAGPPRERLSSGLRDIPSRVSTCLQKLVFGGSEVIAFIGTLHQPYSADHDLCVEFMTYQNEQWHSLGVTQLSRTAGLWEFDVEQGSMMGFVAHGTHWIYLFEDKLWIVPVPANPYLPPSAK